MHLQLAARCPYIELLIAPLCMVRATHLPFAFRAPEFMYSKMAVSDEPLPAPNKRSEVTTKQSPMTGLSTWQDRLLGAIFSVVFHVGSSAS